MTHKDYIRIPSIAMMILIVSLHYIAISANSDCCSPALCVSVALYTLVEGNVLNKKN